MALHRLAAPQGAKVPWGGRAGPGSQAPSQQPDREPGSPRRGQFPGYREGLRLGWGIGLRVGVTFSKVHSQAGAWTGGSGLDEMDSWVMVGDGQE